MFKTVVAYLQVNDGSCPDLVKAAAKIDEAKQNFAGSYYVQQFDTENDADSTLSVVFVSSSKLNDNQLALLWEAVCVADPDELQVLKAASFAELLIELGA